jgi:hypothetical protein
MSEPIEQTVNGDPQPQADQIGRWPRDPALPAAVRLRAGIMNPLALGGIVLGIALIAANVFDFSTQPAAAHTHDGVVSNCTNSMLTMTDETGMRSSHEVLPSTKVTRDGVACQGADLNSGTRIRVTTEIPLKGPALVIEAFERFADAAK